MRSMLIILGLILVPITSCKKENSVDPFAEDSGIFNDSRDNNEYNWVRIGEQVWMAENLAFLPEVYDSSEGSEDVGKENDSFFYVYNYNGNDVANAKATQNYNTYGVLYNWHASMDVCPVGWHLPSDDEWIELEQELGMTDGLTLFNIWRGTNEGGKLKEVGSTHWDSVNEGATNLVGFTALPGGWRTSNYYEIGKRASFQSASLHTGSSTANVYRVLGFEKSTIIRTYASTSLGISIRCVKDK